MKDKNYWSLERIEQLRASGGGEAYSLERIEAAALLYLYERDCVLCEMSANDGEWPEGSGIIGKRRKRMKVLYGILSEEADGCVPDVEQQDLIWGVLHMTCERLGYKAVVWGID